MYRERRRCLACGYVGTMKTWLGNYIFPQFVAIVGFFCWLIPGLIFTFWVWGKFKCPSCGELAKNVPLATSDEERAERPQQQNSYKICPFCAEEVRQEAIKCKHCGSALNIEQRGAGPGDARTGVITPARLACSDGNCTGTIGEDGNCRTCSKHFTWCEPIQTTLADR